MITRSSELQGNTIQPDIYNKILPLLPEERDSSILDVGAGSGFFCAKMRESGYTNLSACDLPESNFQVDDVPYHGCDLNDSIPLPDESIDCTVSIEVAEHIEHHQNYFSEIFRILKPGGRAIFTTPNIQGLGSRMHFLWHGTTDGARRPLDPAKVSGLQHVNCVGIQQFMYYIDHNGGEIMSVGSNHYRASAQLASGALHRRIDEDPRARQKGQETSPALQGSLPLVSQWRIPVPPDPVRDRQEKARVGCLRRAAPLQSPPVRSPPKESHEF